MTVILLLGFSKPQLTEHQSLRLDKAAVSSEPVMAGAFRRTPELEPVGTRLVTQDVTAPTQLAATKVTSPRLNSRAWQQNVPASEGGQFVGGMASNTPQQVGVRLSETLKAKLPVKSRLFSFTTRAPYEGILGPIERRVWLADSNYSPDKALRELNHQAKNSFLSVGFPDIRTYARRSPVFDYRSVDPLTWYELVAWRVSDDSREVQEPIAHVRCMGLSPQAVAKRADRYESLILTLADEHNLSANLIKAVITQESCFNRHALSPVGAIGLMQLMPKTASWLNVRDPRNPEQNLRAGVRYLAKLLEEFDTLELALAAYNAGPGNVRRYKGIPPFKETIGYVQKVQANYRRYAAANHLAKR